MDLVNLGTSKGILLIDYERNSIYFCSISYRDIEVNSIAEIISKGKVTFAGVLLFLININRSKLLRC